MDCFFGSFDLNTEICDSHQVVVSFNIPDIGIRFKAPFKGVNQNHCDLASLLALLEFIDGNQKYFSNHTYQIYGNNHRLIEQVNGREPFPPEFTNLMDKTADYRKKYRFTLGWVPSNDNPAFDQLYD